MLTKEEYEKTKKRIEVGEVKLEGKWHDPHYQKQVTLFHELVEQVLEYEITHEKLQVH